MKKTLIILSILILVLTLISCSNTEITENNNLEEQTDEKEIVIKEDTESDLDTNLNIKELSDFRFFHQDYMEFNQENWADHMKIV